MTKRTMMTTHNTITLQGLCQPGKLAGVLPLPLLTTNPGATSLSAMWQPDHEQWTINWMTKRTMVTTHNIITLPGSVPAQVSQHNPSPLPPTNNTWTTTMNDLSTLSSTMTLAWWWQMVTTDHNDMNYYYFVDLTYLLHAYTFILTIL